MQARRIARELALLSISQLPANPERLDSQDPQRVILAAVRTLTGEVQDTQKLQGRTQTRQRSPVKQRAPPFRCSKRQSDG